MTKNQLTKCWNELFNNILPISHDLKNKFNERWFRIHTLPDSKRYPENESEYAEIFKRHNLILTDLFGENNSIFMISMGYGLNEESIIKDEILESLDLQENFWMSIDDSDEIDEESYYLNIFYDEINFSRNSIDNLLRLIANEEIRGVLFFSIERNIVYHPYDGGADILLVNSEVRNKYKKKYKDWLSNHPKGL